MYSGAALIPGGFTWAAGFLALLNVLVGGLLVTIVRTRPHLKKIANEREANLLSERAEEMRGMRERLASLEAGREADRKEAEVKLELERAQHRRERAYERHKVNNLQQAFDALILLLEDIPQAAPVVVKIKEMRSRQLEAEALEAGKFHAENIAGVGQ